VFETSRWNLRNRRALAALERLGKIAGTGIVGVGSMPRRSFLEVLRPAERAMALVEAGDQALTLMIETAATPVGADRGQARQIWKTMTPETGARADVFVTHGLAATTATLASAPGHHLSVQPQLEARELLRATFPWSEEEEQLVQEQVKQIDAETGSGGDESFIWLAFHAIRFIVGEAAAVALPGFPSFVRGLFSGELRAYGLEVGILDTSPEAFLSQQAWRVCAGHAMQPYLRISDPDGMRKWRADEAE
jgi:hypothetical protein